MDCSRHYQPDQANGENLPPSNYGINVNGRRTFNHILISGYEKPQQCPSSQLSPTLQIDSINEPMVEKIGEMEPIIYDENNISSIHLGVISNNATLTLGSPVSNITLSPSPPTGNVDRTIPLSNVTILSHKYSDEFSENLVYNSTVSNNTALMASDECRCAVVTHPMTNDVKSDAILSHTLLQNNMIADTTGSTSYNSIEITKFNQTETEQSELRSHCPAIHGIPPQITSDVTQTSRDEVCGRNLNSVEVPHNLLDDDWERTPSLMKELAWIMEESLVLLPPELDVNCSLTQPSLPIAIDFAWRHGSLELRQRMWDTHTSKICTLVKKLHCGDDSTITDAEFTLMDGTNILKLCNTIEKERFDCLRKEAQNALQLGFRRSDSIEKELNVMCGYKWREAVEEVGESGVGVRVIKSRRLRKKRNIYEGLLQSALTDSTTDAELVANISPFLTPLEEELAWLVEESLILLPKGMVETSPQPNSLNDSVTETVISAGSIAKSKEIDWGYVERNASSNLKDALERIGGIKRRPLQRLVRSHDREVINAFQNRRENVATLLLLRGYRREETRLSLPSHELLVHTGMDKVWSLRLARRRQNNSCDTVLHGTPKAIMSPKRPRLTSPRARKVRCSILTVEEEEIAWLREEYEYEYGMKWYDWEYIEENASARLRKRLKEKQCNLSKCPTVPGVSRLHAMVRLAIPTVNDAFERKRINIRYAISQRGFRRQLGKSLPVIPDAPPSIPLVRNQYAGTHVMDIEYDGRDHHDEEHSCDEDSEAEADLYLYVSKGISSVGRKAEFDANEVNKSSAGSAMSDESKRDMDVDKNHEEGYDDEDTVSDEDIDNDDTDDEYQVTSAPSDETD